MKRRHHSNEFKLRVVERAFAIGKGAAAFESKVHRTLVTRWCEDERYSYNPQKPEKGSVYDGGLTKHKFVDDVEVIEPEPLRLRVELPEGGIEVKIADGARLIGTLHIDKYGFLLIKANYKKKDTIRQLSWKVLERLCEVGL